MQSMDVVTLSIGALRSHRLRSVLSMVGIGIGIAAVLLLTSIGEGTRQYILAQFTQFGTNILAINPGKTETIGIPGVLGGTTHKLTLEDAEALRRVPFVESVVPVAMGQARVEAAELGRSVYIFGVTSSMPAVWKFRVRQGVFLPPGDPRRGGAVTVLGPTLKRELFGEESALGRFVRVAGFRLRVIGVLEPKGQMLGYDIDDCVYVPVATAMKMFNQDELVEVDVLFTHERQVDVVTEEITRVLKERHGGREDFSITTQTAMLDTMGNIMQVITLAVGGIAAVSLLVGAIGILTLMWIAVGERTSEIGLVRALGASARQVHLLFLMEAVILAVLGGIGGLGVGLGLAAGLRVLVPGLPVVTPFMYIPIALTISFVTGLGAGVLPARRAAAMDPIVALREE